MPAKRTRAKPPAPGLRVRRATPADAPLLGRHRAGMFRDMGRLPPGDRREGPLVRATAAQARRALRAGTMAAWIAEERGAPLGSGAVLLRDILPNPARPEPRVEAYVLNVYTEPAARRRGVATAVMEALLAFCRRERVARAALHCSDAGRAVYERLGFTDPGNWLELRWGTEPAPQPARRGIPRLAPCACGPGAEGC